MSRTAVIVHVFYPGIWPELAGCVRAIGACDLFATVADDAVAETVRRGFPAARIVPCENVGYDVWPFLKVMGSLDPSAYGVVVKLHTKRNVDDGLWYDFNHVRLYGAAWRNHLLAFARTPAAWARTVAKLSKPSVGMVGDRHLVMRRRDVPYERAERSFDAAVELMGLQGTDISRTGQYVAGTMFAAKPAALRPLLDLGLSAADFEAPCGHATETFAHTVERAFGLSVSKAGLRIAAFNGSLALRRLTFPFRPGRP